MVQWHECESSADHDRIDPTNGVDQWSVFPVIDAQGLERALETMNQVNSEGKNTDKIDGYQPELLESDVDATINVLDGFIMTRVGDHGELIGKAHFDPEITHVDAQEGEDQDAQHGHIFGSPGGPCDFSGLVIRAFSFAVGQP